MHFRGPSWLLFLLLCLGRNIQPAEAALPKYHLEADLGPEQARANVRESLATNGFYPAVPAGRTNYFAELVQQARQLANTGNADAQFRLGAVYEAGVAAPKDEREAARWFRLAAEQKHPTAQFCLAMILERGSAGVTNRVEADQWLLRAAEGGCAPAQLLRALTPYNGRFGVTNEAEGFVWLSRAADQKLPLALHQLGQAHWKARGTPTNMAAALRAFTEAADLGYKPAYLALAVIRSDSSLPEFDPKEAAHWLHLAAEADVPHGKTTLAVGLIRGDPVPQDLAEGFKMLRYEAARGDIYAQDALGWIYAETQFGPDFKEAVHWLEMGASNGVAMSQNNLGFLTEYGKGTVANPARAFELYRKAAEQENSLGMANLARCFRLGIGTGKDLAAHNRWMRRSAEAGFDKAQLIWGAALLDGQYGETNAIEGLRLLEPAVLATTNTAMMVYLGEQFESGRLLTTDYAKAFEWYQRAAQAGDLKGRCQQARCLFMGRGAPAERALGMRLLEKAAADGSGDAAELLGLSYLKGDQGFPRDEGQAHRWLERGAALGHPGSLCWLAEAHWRGRGAPKDFPRCFELARRSAEAGSAAGQEMLATCYFSGIGTATNLTEAVRWLRRSASQNWASGQLKLAEVLLDGRWGLPRDPAAALPLLQAAASAGLIPAQIGLGRYLYEGSDGRTNWVESLHWARRAAEQGSPEAQLTLANMLGKGEGGPKDPEGAYVWARLSEKQGFQKAHHVVLAAFVQLPPSKIPELDRRVRDFQPHVEMLPKPPVEEPAAGDAFTP